MTRDQLEDLLREAYFIGYQHGDNRWGGISSEMLDQLADQIDAALAPTTVWGVWCGEYEDRHLRLVLSSLEDADAVVERINADTHTANDFRWSDPLTSALTTKTLAEATADLDENLPGEVLRRELQELESNPNNDWRLVP